MPSESDRSVCANESGAVISTCGRYRYSLTRSWLGGEGRAVFICLNPSTADASIDDPTIRRIVGFAKLWGYASVSVGNLFAWRATDRGELRRVRDPVGPENDRYLRQLAKDAAVLVAAWGTDGALFGRADQVRRLLPTLQVLRMTAAGHPQHPLYLPKELVPVPWPGR